MHRLLALLAALAIAVPAGAQEAIPQNDGWVTDLAGFLTPPEKQALETLMESYKVGSTHEIARETTPRFSSSPAKIGRSASRSVAASKAT